jgi:hypothetical protein
MFDYSCLFRYGDNHVGSSGVVYFHTIQDFEGWFKTSSQIRWAILAKSETGEVVSRLERPTPKLAGSEPLPELGNA